MPIILRSLHWPDLSIQRLHFHESQILASHDALEFDDINKSFESTAMAKATAPYLLTKSHSICLNKWRPNTVCAVHFSHNMQRTVTINWMVFKLRYQLRKLYLFEIRITCHLSWGRMLVGGKWSIQMDCIRIRFWIDSDNQAHQAARWIVKLAFKGK